MHREEVRYKGDGLTMHGQLYWDQTDQGACPGILVFPGASGIIDHTNAAAGRLAELGYVTLACDYYGDGFGVEASDAELLKRYQELQNDSGKFRARTQAALKALTARPEVNVSKIGAIGFCFGGAAAFELACAGAPLVAVVGFHTSIAGVTLSDAKNIVGRVLLCNGDEDPIAPAEDREKFMAAMRAASVKWQLKLYGGVVHSFTDPTGGK